MKTIKCWAISEVKEGFNLWLMRCCLCVNPLIHAKNSLKLSILLRHFYLFIEFLMARQGKKRFAKIYAIILKGLWDTRVQMYKMDMLFYLLVVHKFVHLMALKEKKASQLKIAIHLKFLMHKLNWHFIGSAQMCGGAAQ